MDPLIYRILTEQEHTHWWFRTRRALSFSLLSNIVLPAHASILEAGCGSGGNLPMLSRLGTVCAFEPNDGVRTHASARGIAEIEAGSLPANIPFTDKTFDLIALFDVLEHIEDDAAALKALTARLNPGGVLLLTVPAFAWLSSSHDKLHHHYRRYSKGQLLKLLDQSSLKVEVINYWNFFLFPVAVIVRLANAIGMIKHQPGVDQPSPIINEAIFQLVSSERHLIHRVRLPFGLSMVAVARKV